MDGLLFTLADIVRFTASKRRSVQLWAEGGVIRADPSTEREGSGVHRRFSKDEVIVACVIAAFANDNATIGSLIRLANGIRVFMDNDEFKIQYIYGAIQQKYSVFLI